MRQTQWNEGFFTQHREMDNTHQAFVKCVNALLIASDAEQQTALEEFARHVRHHFEEEDSWMRESVYPSAACHIDEHAAVLKSLGEVHDALAAGRHDVVRNFAQALIQWFPEHLQVMDQGLAQWLIKCQLGGLPVTIHRRKHLVSSQS